jgi:formyltetrahydrofolate hydrolase
MKKASHNVEKMILVKALQNVSDDKVFINGNKTIVFE